MKEEFGVRLKHFREAAGLSQKELSEKLDVSHNKVKNWESLRSLVPAGIIDDICSVLDIGINEFYGIDNPTENGLYTKENSKLIKKFSELDNHGKEMVMMVLEKEHQRIKARRDPFVSVYPMFSVSPERIDVDYYPQAAGMGFGQDVDASFPEKLQLNKDIIPEHTDFVIRVTGDSMEPTFYSGDLLFVERTNVLRKGDIGVFNLNGEALVKEYGENELISHNKKYGPIRALEGCYIQGRILGKVEDG